MHRAVIGYVNMVFREAAKDELLDVRRANIEMSLAVLLEVHQQFAPITELFLVTLYDVFAHFVAPGTSRWTERGYAVARVHAVKQHHIGDRSFSNAPGGAAPTRVNHGRCPRFGV